tara:strand:- start:370 stop:552 length:183 start_codon:yes stop_codon:yes gene_type:complete
MYLQEGSIGSVLKAISQISFQTALLFRYRWDLMIHRTRQMWRFVVLDSLILVPILQVSSD